jgi:hypothetical protein
MRPSARPYAIYIHTHTAQEMEEALVGLLSYAAQLPQEAWSPEAAVQMLQVLQALKGSAGVVA